MSKKKRDQQIREILEVPDIPPEDGAMLYLARDVSQQSFEIEKKKRDEHEKRMEEEAIRRSLIDQQRQQQVLAMKQQAQQQQQGQQLQQQQVLHQQLSFRPLPSTPNLTTPGKPPLTTQTSKKSFHDDLEEAIVQSLIEATKSGESTSSAPVPIPSPAPTPTRQNSQSQSHSMNDYFQKPPLLPKTSEKLRMTEQQQVPLSSYSHDDISDPAVVAFMERRKQRLILQKEEALAKQVLEEAERMQVSPTKLAIDMQQTFQMGSSLKAPATTPFKESSTSFKQAPPSQSTLQRQDSKQGNQYRSESNDYVAKNQEAFTPGRGGAGPDDSRLYIETSGASTPYTHGALSNSMPISPDHNYDASHLFHPDNALAMKTISALVQIARKKTKELPEYANIPREAASMQLAMRWMNDASIAVLSGKPLKTPDYSEMGPPPPRTPMMEAPPSTPVECPPSRSLTSLPSFRKETIDNMSSKLMESKQSSHSFGALSRQPSTDHRTLSRQSSEQQPSSRPNSDYLVPDHLSETWKCGLCTLMNKAQFLACEACGVPRPSR